MTQPRTGSDPLHQAAESLQPLRALRQLVVLGVVVLALLLLLLAFTLINRSAQTDVAQAEATLSALRGELIQLQTPQPTVQALMATLTTTHVLAEQIRAAAPPASLDWPALIAALDRYDPNRIVLTTLTQVDQRITLTGLAANDEAVVAYTQAIEESGYFAAVVLQSLRIIPAPTATPAPTVALTPPAPSAAVAAPAPALQPPFLAAATTIADFVIIVEVDQ